MRKTKYIVKPTTQFKKITNLSDLINTNRGEEIILDRFGIIIGSRTSPAGAIVYAALNKTLCFTPWKIRLPRVKNFYIVFFFHSIILSTKPTALRQTFPP